MALVGEGEEVEVSALLGECLGLRAKESKVGETPPSICDQELFVLFCDPLSLAGGADGG